MILFLFLHKYSLENLILWCYSPRQPLRCTRAAPNVALPEDGLQRDEEGQEAAVTSEPGSGARPPGRSSPDGNANGEEAETEREREETQPRHIARGPHGPYIAGHGHEALAMGGG